jgi:hypothetical protein
VFPRCLGGGEFNSNLSAWQLILGTLQQFSSDFKILFLITITWWKSFSFHHLILSQGGLRSLGRVRCTCFHHGHSCMNTSAVPCAGVKYGWRHQPARGDTLRFEAYYSRALRCNSAHNEEDLIKNVHISSIFPMYSKPKFSEKSVRGAGSRLPLALLFVFWKVGVSNQCILS